MKKIFEEPSIECIKLISESITNVVDASLVPGETEEGWTG